MIMILLIVRRQVQARFQTQQLLIVFLHVANFKQGQAEEESKREEYALEEKMKAAASGGRRRRSRPGGDPGNCPPDGNGCHRGGDPGNRPLPDRVVSRDGGDPSNPPGEGSPEGKKIQHSCLQIKKEFESLSFRMALRMVTNTAKKSHQKTHKNSASAPGKVNIQRR